MKSPYWGMVWVFILAFGLVACSGDDESENSATGAPESILGYKMVMTVRTVEVVGDIEDTQGLEKKTQNGTLYSPALRRLAEGIGGED